MEKKTVILIPSSSKNCNYNGLKQSSLIGILYKSLLNFDITKYTFIVGFDDDDIFFLNNKNSLKKKLPNNFHLYYFLFFICFFFKLMYEIFNIHICIH